MHAEEKYSTMYITNLILTSNDNNSIPKNSNEMSLKDTVTLVTGDSIFGILDSCVESEINIDTTIHDVV